MAKKNPKKKRKLSAYNLHMKREMKRGRTFKQAVASWRGFKRKPRVMPKGKTVRKLRSVSKRSKKTMAKRSFLSTATLMKFARLAALGGPAAMVAMGPGDAPTKIKEGLRIYTGVDMNTGAWSLGNLAQGWLPFVGTSLVTHGISKLIGIIRRL